MSRLGHGLAQHEHREVRDARRLLHVVRDDDHGHGLGEVADGLLDLVRRDGVERRAGLVHEQHLGVGRQGAGDAQALLLTTRKPERTRRELVFDLVPQRGAPQAVLDERVKVRAALHPTQARAIGDVVVDGKREHARLLEDHPHVHAQLDRVDRAMVDVLAVERDGTAHLDVSEHVVHAVQTAQQRGLATAGRPDERGDLVGRDTGADSRHRRLARIGDRYVFQLEIACHVQHSPSVCSCRAIVETWAGRMVEAL